MTTLITGGTGKTGSHLAKLLHNAGHPVLIATRKGVAPEGLAGLKAVTFDWFNPSTFINPFDVDKNITRLYLVVPNEPDPLSIAKPFIDLAVERGVKRIVFCSATITDRGSSIWWGGVHNYVAGLGVEYAVLRPTWFMDNFTINFYHSIRDENTVFSATGDGRIPFVSVEDIAQAAFDRLTESEPLNRDVFVLGPELFTYDQAAELLSGVLGRKIVHKKITEQESASIFSKYVDPALGNLLARGEVDAANGKEALLQNEPNAIIGKRTLKDFFVEKRNVWIKDT